ncbi:MAG: cell division protein CrgA [Candidatus Ancillula sp.]|jgi:anti-sigma28 factor (negative regulator of flagellin synthesis)|nr:cell division protein CrgA [Candidatus Ancillula sp.]
MDKVSKRTPTKKGKKVADSKESVAVRSRSGNPAKRGEVEQELKAQKVETTKTPIKFSKYGMNPLWLIPTMLGLMIIGMVWLVVFYLTYTIGGYPIPVLQYWNLVVAFGFIIAGFILTTRWK